MLLSAVGRIDSDQAASSADHFALDNGTSNAFRKGYKPLDSGNFAGATKPPLTPEHLGRLDLPTLLQARQS